MSVAAFTHALLNRWPGLAAAETGGPPPRKRTGPVLMGDIHGSYGGRPVLLLLWERWEKDAKGDEN